jgi:hypothetical protein
MSLTTNNPSPLPARKGDRSEIWRRGAIMLIFLICFGFGQCLLTLIAVMQFIWLAVHGQYNDFIAEFGRSLARWLSEAAEFLSGATNDKPFPWAPWPGA